MFYAYIVANRSRTLYVGITSNLENRAWQHKQKIYDGFSARYNCDRLYGLSAIQTADLAIARKKQIKSWARQKKLNIIEQENPTWLDLSDRLYHSR